MTRKVIYIIFLNITVIFHTLGTNKLYSLWYNRPAFNRGADFNVTVARGFPYDEDWERWSLPIGNGYMGACIFGRTDIERIQLSEKTMGNKGCYSHGGFSNFAEIYLDINHNSTKNYKRELRLNDAISTVSYQHDGVNYTREYFANYPDNVIVVKLVADKPGSLSFRIRPVLPYLHPYDEQQEGRTGEIKAENDLITLQGEIQFFHSTYECQIKAQNFGGKLIPGKDELTGNGIITVQQADSVVLLISAGTSYELNENVFLLPPAQKCQGNKHPHQRISGHIQKASTKGYEKLKEEHINDYQNYFNRADICLTDKTPNIPTDKLLSNYKQGKHDPYLEELYFQYGRYLLIASSRKGSLPPNLQGGWTQYENSPWSGGYWHNINIQMNYWPVFNTNLTELFQPFVEYNEAYRKAAIRNAMQYIEQNNPSQLDRDPEENGWTIGTGASGYNVDPPGGHSGPGTGGFTTKLFWDYYDFTRDREVLEKHTYPALEGMAKFLSKTLKKTEEGLFLVAPSSSPEQYHNGVPYITIGCTFDQGMVWENYRDLLEAANILKKKSKFLKKVQAQITHLDPIHIGDDGQLKEYREEKKYGEIGDPVHRHISHLCTLYPGTLVNSTTPEWLDAARISLEKRNSRPMYWKGWPIAHQMNAWARLKEGDKAYNSYKRMLSEGVLENLWGLCPPFQIDSNFGGTAGVAEMLLQSHEGYIEPLPALPGNWKEGFYNGLLARGNFEISVKWQNNKVIGLGILSHKGELCRLKYPHISEAKIMDTSGNNIIFKVINENLVEFKTMKDNNYKVVFK